MSTTAAALHYSAMAAQAAAGAHAPEPVKAALGLMLDNAAALRRHEYIAALRAHDWFYAYSDDHNVYVRGDAKRAQLDHMRATLDPDAVLWNKYAPAEFQVRA